MPIDDASVVKQPHDGFSKKKMADMTVVRYLALKTRARQTSGEPPWEKELVASKNKLRIGQRVERNLPPSLEE